jgi:hypothetical protein
LQVFAHTGAISLLFSRRDIHRFKVSSNFIKTCSEIHSEFGGTFTELKNPQDILGNKLPPLWPFCFPKCLVLFFFFSSETSQVPAKYLPGIMGKETENHQFLCCVTPLAMSIAGVTPTSAPLHVDPISSNDHILRCYLTLNTIVLPSTLWVVHYIERSQH